MVLDSEELDIPQNEEVSKEEVTKEEEVTKDEEVVTKNAETEVTKNEEITKTDEEPTNIEESINIEGKEKTETETIKVLFEKDNESAEINDDAKDPIRDQTLVSKTVDLTEILESEDAELIKEIKYTSHPLSMNTDECQVKMVDLKSNMEEMPKYTIAPDGLIPNSEIRKVLNKPCLDRKIETKQEHKEDLKNLLDEVLVKYMPKELLITHSGVNVEEIKQRAVVHIPHKHDAGSKAPKIHTNINLDDDHDDDINQQLMDDLGNDDDIEGMIENIALKSKSKKRKYTRRITKASLKVQLEEQAKEREEQRRENLRRKQEEELERQREEEELKRKHDEELDILDKIDETIRETTLADDLKAQEKLMSDTPLSDDELNELMFRLIERFGDIKPYQLIYNASIGNEEAGKILDDVLNNSYDKVRLAFGLPRSNRLYKYVSNNIPNGEIAIIKAALITDDPTFGSKEELLRTQEKISSILGSESRMAKFLFNLAQALVTAADKIKVELKDDDNQAILLLHNVFKDIKDSVEELDKILGDHDKTKQFLDLIRNCRDNDINEFSIDKQPRQHQRRDSTIMGLTPDQLRLVPQLPVDDMENKFIENAAKALTIRAQRKERKHKEKPSSPPSLTKVSSYTDSIDIYTDQNKEGDKAKPALPPVTYKDFAKDADHIAKRVKQGMKPEYQPTAKTKGNLKKAEIGGAHKEYSEPVEEILPEFEAIDIQSIEGLSKVKGSTEPAPKISAEDVLKNFIQRLTSLEWWPKDVELDLRNDGIFIILIKLLPVVFKLEQNTQIADKIIEFLKYFKISRRIKNDAIDRLNKYLVFELDCCKKAKEDRDIAGHAYHVKRVLNAYRVLSELGEDTEFSKQHFLKNDGYYEPDKKKKGAGGKKSKKGESVLRKHDLDDYESAMQKSMKDLIAAMQDSNDPMERMIANSVMKNQDQSYEAQPKPSETGKKKTLSVSVVSQSTDLHDKDDTKRLYIAPQVPKVLSQETIESKGSIMSLDSSKVPGGIRRTASGGLERDKKSKEKSKGKRKEKTVDTQITLPVPGGLSSNESTVKPTTPTREKKSSKEQLEHGKTLQEKLKDLDVPFKVKSLKSAVSEDMFDDQEKDKEKDIEKEKEKDKIKTKEKEKEKEKEKVPVQEGLEIKVQPPEIKLKPTVTAKPIHMAEKIKNGSIQESEADITVKEATKQLLEEKPKTLESKRILKSDRKSDDKLQEDRKKTEYDADSVESVEIKELPLDKKESHKTVSISKPDLNEKEKIYEKAKEFDIENLENKSVDQIIRETAEAMGIKRFDKKSPDQLQKDIMTKMEMDKLAKQVGKEDEVNLLKRESKITLIKEKEMQKEKEAFAEKIAEQSRKSQLAALGQLLGQGADNKETDQPRKSIIERMSRGGLPKSDGADNRASLMKSDSRASLSKRVPIVNEMKTPDMTEQYLEPKTIEKIQNILEEMQRIASSDELDADGSTIDSKVKMKQLLNSPDGMTLMNNILDTMENVDISILSQINPHLLHKLSEYKESASQVDPVEIMNIAKEIMEQLVKLEPEMIMKKNVVEKKVYDKVKDELVAVINHPNEIEDNRERLNKVNDMSNLLKFLINKSDEIDDNIKNMVSEVAIESEQNETEDESALLKKHDKLQKMLKGTETRKMPTNKRLREKKKVANSENAMKAISKQLNELNIQLKGVTSNLDDTVDELLKQSEAALKDPQKYVEIAQALSLFSNVNPNDVELQEKIATIALQQLILDMQNLTSDSLKQHEIPATLIRCTTNILLLQNLGIKDVDDFQAELDKYKRNYPDETNFSKNPLAVNLLGESKKISISKYDLAIDPKLTFMRDVSSIKPVDRQKGVEMGLITDEPKPDSDKSGMDILTYTDIDTKASIKPIVNVAPHIQKRIAANYHKGVELKTQLFEIEQMYDAYKKAFKGATSAETMDDIGDFKQSLAAGSSDNIRKLIHKRPAIQAIINARKPFQFDFDSKSPRRKKKSKIDLSRIESTDDSYDSFNEFIREKKYGEDDDEDEDDDDDEFSKSPNIITHLRKKLKKEINKEYPQLQLGKQDGDADGKGKKKRKKKDDINPRSVDQLSNFKRFYGDSVSTLPFIGNSKNVLGKLLDQGLRTLHFNMGPGQLIKAILESEELGGDGKTKGLKKFVDGDYLKSCHIIPRPTMFPVTEWAKIAAPGTRRNLKPNLFPQFHRGYHCSHQYLAEKHLHRHGIAIKDHINRYQTIEVINKSLQETAYTRIQHSLLKCLMRVLED